MGDFHARHLAEHEAMRRRWARGEREVSTYTERNPEVPPEKGNQMAAAIGWREQPMTRLLAEAIRLRMVGAELRESASFAELARATLGEIGRSVPEAMHPSECIRLALHTTDDFPGLLGSAAERVFEPAYAEAGAVSRRVSVQRTVDSLRDVDFIRSAEFPPLLETGPGAEYQHGELEIGGEPGCVARYGRLAHFAEELMLLNDADGFGQLVRGAAAAVVDREESLFFGYITQGSGGNGPTLSDQAQLFATATKTLASSGAAISTTSIGIGIADMAEQATPAGRTGVASPKWLVCPPGLLGLAQVELAKMAQGASPEQRIMALASPQLSGKAWYLFASPEKCPSLARLRLSYQPQPEFLTRRARRVDGLEVRLSHVFGAVATGRVGVWKNAGE